MRSLKQLYTNTLRDVRLNCMLTFYVGSLPTMSRYTEVSVISTEQIMGVLRSKSLFALEPIPYSRGRRRDRVIGGMGNLVFCRNFQMYLWSSNKAYQVAPKASSLFFPLHPHWGFFLL